MKLCTLGSIALWLTSKALTSTIDQNPIVVEEKQKIPTERKYSRNQPNEISYFRPNLDYVQRFKDFPFEEKNEQKFENLIFSQPRAVEATSLPTFKEVFKDKPGFFNETLPRIVKHALKFNELFNDTRGIRTLVAGEIMKFNEREAACLICNGFLCSFLGRDTHTDFYPPFSFYRLFAQDPAPFIIEKLKMFMVYFDNLNNLGNHTIQGERESVGNFTVSEELQMLPFQIDETKALPDIQNDYIISSSNKYLGGAPGGVFATGKMQEPVDFATHPEMTIFLLVSPVLLPNEAIKISGAAQFSYHANFGLDLKFTGPTSKTLQEKTRSQAWINVDSIDFRKYPENYQFTQESNERQLTKLSAGITMTANLSELLVTGIWGGDAFGGDSELIFIQMWLVASAAAKSKGPNKFYWLPNAYPCIPCDKVLNLPVPNPTTKQIYEGLMAYLENKPTTKCGLFEFLEKYFQRFKE